MSHTASEKAQCSLVRVGTVISENAALAIAEIQNTFSLFVSNNKR